MRARAVTETCAIQPPGHQEHRRVRTGRTDCHRRRLIFIAGTIDTRFRAFDSRTGQVLWEARHESEGHTTPMTYMAPNGKQYVVVVTTGVNAFALE
jgi:glucose dehydrogenase